VSKELLSFNNKTALIIGGATGMGAATAKLLTDLGTDLIVLDVAEVDYPVKKFLKIDLRDKAAVDAVLEQLDEPIDAILPGPTDTPLARANADIWLSFAQDYRKSVGVECLAPEQMASVMVFLASDAASGINGISLLVDQGHVSSAVAGTHPEPAINMMLGVPQ